MPGMVETLHHLNPLLNTLTLVGWDLAVSAFLGTVLSFAIGAAFDADSWSRWALGALWTGAGLAGLSLWRTLSAPRRPRRPAPVAPEPVVLWIMDRPTPEPAPQRRLLASRESHLADGARFAAHFDLMYGHALRGEGDVEDLRDLAPSILGYARAAGLPPADVARMHASLYGRIGNAVKAAKARARKAGK